MSSEEQEHIVVYVGTGKLVALLGAVGDGETRILQYRMTRDPQGFKGGLVTNIEQAICSLQSILESLVPDRALEEMECHVVLGNAKLKTYGYSSSQYYQGMQRTISAYEIRSVISQTRSVATLPLSEIVLQAVPETFLVNDMQGIRNPIGLEAQRLGVDLKIFTMSFQDFKNIRKVFEALDVEVLGYFPKTLTSSEAILSDQEKNEGVLIIDVAEDATHLVLWKNGCLTDSTSISAGGAQLTQKIANQWSIDLHDARKAKERYASFEQSAQFADEIIPLVERNGQRKIQTCHREFQQSFVEIGKEWLEEILTEGRKFAEARKVLYPHYVFTGGGTRIDGFLEFLQKTFSLVARMGLTRKVEAPNELIVDPSLTACLGMYRWLSSQEREHRKLLAPRGIVEKTISSARSWFANYF